MVCRIFIKNQKTNRRLLQSSTLIRERRRVELDTRRIRMIRESGAFIHYNEDP